MSPISLPRWMKRLFINRLTVAENFCFHFSKRLRWSCTASKRSRAGSISLFIACCRHWAAAMAALRPLAVFKSGSSRACCWLCGRSSWLCRSSRIIKHYKIEYTKNTHYDFVELLHKLDIVIVGNFDHGIFASNFLHGFLDMPQNVLVAIKTVFKLIRLGDSIVDVFHHFQNLLFRGKYTLHIGLRDKKLWVMYTRWTSPIY